ncbi:hypothetical protein V1520DRAFT_342169 [Lipomyces starkeyi]
MLEILIIADCPYTVILHGTNEIIEATDERLQPGRYYIKPSTPHGRIFMTDEPCALHTLSHKRAGRDEEFRQAVRERDGRCVITGVINSDAGQVLRLPKSSHCPKRTILSISAFLDGLLTEGEPVRAVDGWRIWRIVSAKLSASNKYPPYPPSAGG